MKVILMLNILLLMIIMYYEIKIQLTIYIYYAEIDKPSLIQRKINFQNANLFK